MAIDPMMLNAILGTFKNMAEDCRNKKISGSDFDKMCETLSRMEQLGSELSDINEFNAHMINENLYGKFSDYYGRVLAANAQQSASATGDYNDSALLQQSIDALKQAKELIWMNYQEAVELSKGKNAEAEIHTELNSVHLNTDYNLQKAPGRTESFEKESQKSIHEPIKDTLNAFNNSVEVEILTDPTDLINPIQEVINLGEQTGMTYPKFLRLQIETGLDKAMEGSMVSRKALETEKEFISVNPVSPFHLQRIDKKLARFDEIASSCSFNVPNRTELKFALLEVEREFEPEILKWNQIINRWNKLLSDLSIWSLSYCSFALYIKPWNMAKDPVAATIFTQNTGPGIFKEREKLLMKYFGLNFHDIFKHPSFLWSVKYNYIEYSQEFVEFLVKHIYPECKPSTYLSTDLIEKRASFNTNSGRATDREGNPESHFPPERIKEFYNQKFGSGRFESKYGVIAQSQSKAKAWDLHDFQYGS